MTRTASPPRPDYCCVLRVDGSHGLGVGHVKRCLNVAGELACRGISAEFVLRHGDDAIIELIHTAGYRVHRLPPNVSYNDETDTLIRLPLLGRDAILLDISHRQTFREIDGVLGYFKQLSERFGVVGLIDGFMHGCLAGRLALAVDLVVIPYAGADGQDLRVRDARLALGPDYAVLDPSCVALATQPREIADEGRRVLVTAGGSDPTGVSVKSLVALDAIADRTLEVRVVIGPAFDPETTAAIESRAANSGHVIDLIHRPESLAPHLIWCDLAVATSGLTKYEIAATGTPAILLSIDADHVAFHREFDRLGAARHLGIETQISPATLAHEIGDLLDDCVARRRMSAAGRHVSDGRGTERLADALVDLIAAEHGRSARAPIRSRRASIAGDGN